MKPNFPESNKTPLGMIGFGVAGLELWLDAHESSIPLAVPDSYTSFFLHGTPGSGLVVNVRDGILHRTESWQPLFHDTESYQLWRDGAGRRVFVPSRHSPPPRQLTVDAAFRSGEVLGEFGQYISGRQAIYPLTTIDMVLVSNWLAETGDLILHAAGIEVDGAGYVFAGPSGAGKSTLTAELASIPSVKVLGEDQVILRYQHGQVMTYGTPWHTNPARCSPGGVPLRKLFFLERANGHGSKPCGRRTGIERLIQNAIIPFYNRPGVEHILDHLPHLAEQVPFFTIGFKIGADVISLVRDGTLLEE